MRALRHRHYLRGLAMLVFAMQALLAFAHTHTHSLSRSGPDRLAVRAITYGMCRPGGEKPCPPAPKHDEHQTCSICWTVAMAGPGLLASPPAILPRHARAMIAAPVRISGLTGSEPNSSFEPRAPPLA